MITVKNTYLQKEGCPIMGIPASLEIFCKDNVKLRKASSFTVRWGAKQAIAHSRISTPVKNCFPRISQTPPLGKACCRVRPKTNKRIIKKVYIAAHSIFQVWNFFFKQQTERKVN